MSNGRPDRTWFLAKDSFHTSVNCGHNNTQTRPLIHFRQNFRRDQLLDVKLRVRLDVGSIESNGLVRLRSFNVEHRLLWILASFNVERTMASVSKSCQLSLCCLKWLFSIPVQINNESFQARSMINLHNKRKNKTHI